MSNKTKVHTRYQSATGERVPSVTTVLGILNKPALIHWAWQCGVKGEDYRKVRDEAADIGTLAHYLIMCHLTRQEPDTSEYSAENIDKAENALLSYYEWEKNHPIEPVLIEQALISEVYGFGGTIDCLAKLNSETILIDHKTGKALYPEMFYQLAAYRQLLLENGYRVGHARILRVGRDESEGFEEQVVTEFGKPWDIFHHCLRIYNLQKKGA